MSEYSLNSSEGKQWLPWFPRHLRRSDINRPIPPTEIFVLTDRVTAPPV